MDINRSGKYIFLGGTRSGKSLIAEKAISSHHTRACYIATAPRAWIKDDPPFALRIAEHQRRRGDTWRNVELDDPEDLYELIACAELPTVVDSVGGWVAARPEFDPDLGRLEEVVRRCAVPIAFVAEEVGLAIHPESEAGRRYVDLVGAVNQKIARNVDRAFLVVAGKLAELHFPEFTEELS